MEKNIFEGAKFGDRYQMRNGWVAIYLSHYTVNDNSILHRLCTELDGIFVVDDNGSVCQSALSNKWDIVSRYQEPITSKEIDEDILRDALYNFISENFYVTTSEGDYDYSEQSIGYCSDRTHKDSKNVDLYAISDDFIDYYRKTIKE